MTALPKNTNIILIGMCGVGKSTIGVLLAKALGFDFLDTDVYVQSFQNRTLQSIINELGIKKFCQIEEQLILTINVKNTVIATGGSVAYSPKAMAHLASNGFIIHLDLEFEAIEKRVTNLCSRGIVMETGQTLKSLYEQRQPLYKKYARLTIDCHMKTHEDIITEIIDRL